MDEFKDAVLNNYLNFSGRATRRDYWMFFLIYSIIIVVAIILANVLDTIGTIIYTLVSLGLFLPAIAAAVRRLHDCDKSGWFFLLCFVPFANFYILYLFVNAGTPGDNRFGPEKISNS